ncbi:substrate-binding domain-containing protein [Roseovarius salis]|uniref:substrate-binding domain-containing protein n=1 Tax=Roseovarius salis TaxID=3376063 RepID=UPI0037CA09AD
MAWMRAAGFAALFLWVFSTLALAQDVTLTSRNGDVEISGNLLGFDGEFYRVETVYGELTVDGSGVICDGPGCPDLEDYVARLTFSGAPTMGRVLLPALIEAFAIRNTWQADRRALSEGESVYTITDPATDHLLGEFTIRLNNTDQGFADLLADEADVVMSLREVRQDEVQRGKAAGVGDLSARAGSRVIALDALVPVVAPSNPVRSLTLTSLAAVLSGEIDNWKLLGGPDAPIAVHVHEAGSGLGQITRDKLLGPAGVSLVETAERHPGGQGLAQAVAADPFALGVTSRSEAAEAWELALSGDCGFVVSATRRAIKTEDYPLTSPMFLYLPARRFPKLMRDFLSYLRDPSAQLVIRRAGFVDQAPEEIPVRQQGNRFANAIAQAGEEIELAELQRMVSYLSPLQRLTTTFRFEAGSVRLDAQSRSNAEQLAREMELGLYDARRLAFVGFSDSKGAAATNLKIARRRAAAVRKAVTDAAETAALSRIGLETEAFGEAMPMACDDSAWGRQVNRRVEVWVR